MRHVLVLLLLLPASLLLPRKVLALPVTLLFEGTISQVFPYDDGSPIGAGAEADWGDPQVGDPVSGLVVLPIGDTFADLEGIFQDPQFGMELRIGAEAMGPHPQPVSPSILSYSLWTMITEAGAPIGDTGLTWPVDSVMTLAVLSDLTGEPFLARLFFEGDLSGASSPLLAGGTRPGSPAFTRAELSLDHWSGETGLEAEITSIWIVPEPSAAALVAVAAAFSLQAARRSKRRSLVREGPGGGRWP